MSHSVRIAGTALVVLMGLGLAGAALQFLMITLPYLAIFLLGLEDTDVINAMACGIWLLVPPLFGGAILATARACRRLSYERAGVWIGVIAYPALAVAMFLVAPSDSSIGAVGYTSAFVAFPIALGIGVASLLARSHAGRVRRKGRVTPARYAPSQVGPVPRP